MTDLQIKIIQTIQNGIPLSKEPFKEIAESIGITQEELIQQLDAWKIDGTIRRFGAILRHHKAGYSVNTMAVWNVPDKQIEIFGKMAANHRSVSHCYQRPKFNCFPYNLYTMIHGKSRQDCESVASEISKNTGITDFDLLYTTAEFKKSSPVYFTDRGNK